MDAFDVIQSKIYNHRLMMEEMEDDYGRKKRKLEEETSELEEQWYRLNHLFDEFTELFHHYCYNGDWEVEPDSVHSFEKLMGDYRGETEFVYRERRDALEEKIDNLTTIFKREYRDKEDEFEELLRERRKIAEGY